MRWHASAYVISVIFLFLWQTGTGFIIFGLIYNNVVLNEPVAAISASLLFLEPQQWVAVEEISNQQRLSLIMPVLVLAIIAITIAYPSYGETITITIFCFSWATIPSAICFTYDFRTCQSRKPNASENSA